MFLSSRKLTGKASAVRVDVQTAAGAGRAARVVGAALAGVVVDVSGSDVVVAAGVRVAVLVS